MTDLRRSSVITVRIEWDDDDWVFAQVLERPGVFASGRTLAELGANLGEVLTICLSSEGR